MSNKANEILFFNALNQIIDQQEDLIVWVQKIIPQGIWVKFIIEKNIEIGFIPSDYISLQSYDFQNFIQEKQAINAKFLMIEQGKYFFTLLNSTNEFKIPQPKFFMPTELQPNAIFTKVNDVNRNGLLTVHVTSLNKIGFIKFPKEEFALYQVLKNQKIQAKILKENANTVDLELISY